MICLGLICTDVAPDSPCGLNKNPQGSALVAIIGSSGQYGSIRMMCNANLVTYLECTVYMIDSLYGYHRLGALTQT